MVGSQLAVVIPARSEEASIAQIVSAAKRYGGVIVIDDCSSDETAERASAAGATVIRSDRQLGYEAALCRGFAEAEGLGFTHVVTMDGDGEHEPALVAHFRHILLVESIPLVLGVRRRKQRVAESVMGIYVQARFGVHDILCGMKGYDLALYRANGGFDHGDSIGTELAINSIRRGARFREVPVRGKPRSDEPRFDSKVRANLRILAALKQVILDDLSAMKSERRTMAANNIFDKS